MAELIALTRQSRLKYIPIIFKKKKKVKKKKKRKVRRI